MDEILGCLDVYERLGGETCAKIAGYYHPYLGPEQAGAVMFFGDEIDRQSFSVRLKHALLYCLTHGLKVIDLDGG